MKYVVNGRTVTREEFEKQPAKPGWLESRASYVQVIRSNKPLVSDSSGVLPSQVKEERKKLKKLQEQGLLTGVSIANDGTAEFTSPGKQGRVGWMHYRGHADFEGGYRDTYTRDGTFGD